MEVWRIPREKISINTLNERPEEAAGVYAKEDCSIPAGMGKYILVQTNHEITVEVLIEISDKTIPVLVLPEIVYNIKKKLSCIFVENINSESVVLKRGQTVELVTSCIVTIQEEQGQTPAEHNDTTQSITYTSNDKGTCIGGASVGDTEKAGWKADSLQSVEKILPNPRRKALIYL